MLRILAGALALACILVTPAEAKHRHYRHYHHSHAKPIACQITGAGGSWVIPEPCAKRFAKAREANARTFARHAEGAQIVSHPNGCPRVAFCGCGAAVHLLGAPIRALWLAANWFKFPRAEPAPGMAAVRAHHVFAIERVLGNGLVVAWDANSGHGLTRIHVRSLAGYRVVDPRGG